MTVSLCRAPPGPQRRCASGIACRTHHHLDVISGLYGSEDFYLSSGVEGEVITGLLGGVAGTRVLRFLRDVRAKTAALREVVAGNERYKRQRPKEAAAFKHAQEAQSPRTRQVVAALRIANGPPNGDSATLR